MASETSIHRYRRWYNRLLRLYPKSHRERFGESMAQTFNDLCRERRASGRGLFLMALGVFIDTSGAIFKENWVTMNKGEFTAKLVYWIVIVSFLLAIPLVAMQFTDEVRWSLFDFVIMGGALFGIGLGYLLITKQAKSLHYRVAFGIGLVTAFLLFWVNGAVGIIGNEGQPANLLYGAVFIAGLLGSIIARFRPRGMAMTLFTAAAIQLLVPIAALFFWPQISWGEGGMFRVYVLNAFFATLFVASALLFRQAGSADQNTAQPTA